MHTPETLKQLGHDWNGKERHSHLCRVRTHATGDCDCMYGLMRAHAAVWQAERAELLEALRALVDERCKPNSYALDDALAHARAAIGKAGG